MVVTCSMIGASGLGMEVLISVNRIEIGRGLLAGTAVGILFALIAYEAAASGAERWYTASGTCLWSARS